MLIGLQEDLYCYETDMSFTKGNNSPGFHATPI
jgi:hypothetical protein